MKYSLLVLALLAGCTSLPPIVTGENGWKEIGRDDAGKVSVEIRLAARENAGSGVFGHIWEVRLVNSSKQAWCAQVVWMLVDIDNGTTTSRHRLVFAAVGKTPVGYLKEHLWQLERGYLPLQGYGRVMRVSLAPPVMTKDGAFGCTHWTHYQP